VTYIVNSTDGYDRIASVRGVDDRQAVVTFRGVHLWWQSLFNNVIHRTRSTRRCSTRATSTTRTRSEGRPVPDPELRQAERHHHLRPQPEVVGKTGRLDSRTFLTMESAASINAFKNGQLDATGVATKDRRGDEGTRTLNPRLAKVRPITGRERRIFSFTVSEILTVVVRGSP
jgi:peptide/nickel transport system substrate-binding protein